MIVVLPVCHKDWPLMERNLQRAIELDGTTDFNALIAHDEELPLEGFERIKSLADKYFKHVEVFHYAVPPVKEWPAAPNHVWQAVAWHFFDQKKEPWFWWEPDVTPLKPKWLEALWLGYQRGCRPFAGHIVRGMGHMNGVAIYPPDVPNYASKCLRTQAAPWDVTLSDEASKHCYLMNDLIAHYPRHSGWQLILDGEAWSKIENSGAVVFHGFNAIDASDPRPALIVKADDLDKPYDQTDGNFQREFLALLKKGYRPAAQAEVQKPYPSVLNSGWYAHHAMPEPTWKDCYFNPTMCPNGEVYWLISRRWTRVTAKTWHSTLVAYDGRHSKELTFPNQHHLFENEDPRVVYHDGRFYVSHCQWIAESFYQAKQIMSVFDGDWNYIEAWQPKYGYNGFELDPDFGHQEKNWVWFRHGDTWHFVYSFTPHTVVQYDPTTGVTDEYKSESLPQHWGYGEVRGGTPPVRVAGEYVTFFHSSLPWKGKQKKYFMGAYAFEAKPPFRVTRITNKPILRGSEEDSRINGGPLCVFPGGAVLEDGVWEVALGVNDERCAIVRIPHRELEAMLVC